jgi:hypothetical protein
MAAYLRIDGLDPVRVGTLYHDGDRAVRVDFDLDAFEDGETA